MQNPYLPIPVVVSKIITEVETKDIKTFRLEFLNKEDEAGFKYLPGQFAELSLYGKGESPIGIASSPTQPGYIEFTVQKAGVVTSTLHEIEEGTHMGVRGPLGNSWPIEYLEGKNIVVVGGGFAPLAVHLAERLEVGQVAMAGDRHLRAGDLARADIVALDVVGDALQARGR